MIGGYMKRTSLLAIAASASLFATGASAADLGGNCCADLEERIAELEATTVRKGNRKVSLTVSGHVNEEMLLWDDGHERNVYIGTNLVAQTRFRFLGQAKINSDITAGYLLEIGTEAPSIDRNNANADDVSGSVIAIRHSAWWLQHKDYGKVWLGQTSQATDGITEITLANLSQFASQNSGSMIGGWSPVVTATAVPGPFQFYQFFGGAPSARNTAQIGEGNRLNIVKYETPTYAGFIASASYGEDDMWDVALRYAGEMHGFKLAFGIGYEQWTDGNPNGRRCSGYSVDGPCLRAGSISVGAVGNACQQLGLSGPIMHVDTGLFLPRRLWLPA